LISRTPLRISFLGGGTDLPSFYRQEFGAVVSAAINIYIYISAHPYFYRKFTSSIRKQKRLMLSAK